MLCKAWKEQLMSVTVRVLVSGEGVGEGVGEC